MSYAYYTDPERKEREQDELALEATEPPAPQPSVIPDGVYLDITSIRSRIDDCQMSAREIMDALTDENLASLERKLDATGALCAHARKKVTAQRARLRQPPSDQKE